MCWPAIPARMRSLPEEHRWERWRCFRDRRASEIVLGAGAVDAFRRRRHAGGGRRLPAADRIRGHGNRGRVRERSRGREPRSELCAARDLQPGKSGGKDSDLAAAGAAAAGRSAGGGSGSAEGSRVRGPRGRIVLSGMVRPVRGGGGVGRTGLLFLSAAESRRLCSGGRRPAADFSGKRKWK